MAENGTASHVSAREMAVRARDASRKLQAMTTEERVAMLHRVADSLVANEDTILQENAKVSTLGQLQGCRKVLGCLRCP